MSKKPNGKGRDSKVTGAKTMKFAHEEAHGLRQGYIGSEHILLAALRYSTGIAAKFLDSRGVTIDRVRQEAANIVGPGTDVSEPHKLPLTDRARQVLHLSREAAERLEHAEVGTGHLLLGVIASAGGVGAQVLMNLGFDRVGTRKSIEHLLGTPGEAAGSGQS